MNKEKIQQLKTVGFFKKGDLIVYLAIIIVILALFWVFLFSSATQTLKTIEIYSTEGERQVLFNYDVLSQSYEIYNENRVQVEQNDDGLIVVVKNQGGDKFNKVVITKYGHCYIEDANCSYHKDCTLFEDIEHGGQTIVCVPNGITIMGIGGEGQPSDPMIG